VGKGAQRRAHHLPAGAPAMVGTLRFAHPTILTNRANGILYFGVTNDLVRTITK